LGHAVGTKARIVFSQGIRQPLACPDGRAHDIDTIFEPGQLNKGLSPTTTSIMILVAQGGKAQASETLSRQIHSRPRRRTGQKTCHRSTNLLTTHLRYGSRFRPSSRKKKQWEKWTPGRDGRHASCSQNEKKLACEPHQERTLFYSDIEFYVRGEIVVEKSHSQTSRHSRVENVLRPLRIVSDKTTLRHFDAENHLFSLQDNHWKILTRCFDLL